MRGGVGLAVALALVAGGLTSLLDDRTEPPPAAPSEGAPLTGAAPDEAALDVASAPAVWTWFEPNSGQAPVDVLFMGRGADGHAWLRQDAIVLSAGELVHTITFPGSAASLVRADAPTGALTHRYQGAVETWVTGVPQSARVVYEDMWPGIDMVVRHSSGALEFDHIVAPGADPAVIRIHLDGAAVQADGSLAAGGLALAPPVAFQDTPHGRVPVDAAFAPLGTGEFGYSLGVYDASLPLVIDPMAKYSSYIGLGGNDAAHGVAVMQAPGQPDVRWVYLAGKVAGAAYPPGLTGTTTVGSAGGEDAFVAKFAFDLETRTLTSIWFAYVGSGGSDVFRDIKLDAAGNAYVVGSAGGTGFPATANALSYTTDAGAAYNGGTYTVSYGPSGNVLANVPDVVVARLDSNGLLTYGTYMGGSAADNGWAITLMPGGRVGITGDAGQATQTPATPFPTRNAIQPSPNGQQDGFAAVLELSTSPTTPVWATYLGGSLVDSLTGATSVGTDLFVTGEVSNGYVGTPGTFMPTQPTPRSGAITRIDITGAIVASTFIGVVPSGVPPATSITGMHEIVFDGAGGLWVAGVTSSATFPMCPASCAPGSPPSIQATPTGGTFDNVLFHIDLDLTELDWSTYYGADSLDYSEAIAFEPTLGEVGIAGQLWHNAGTFPEVDAIWPGGGVGGIQSHFTVFRTGPNNVRIADVISAGTSDIDHHIWGMAMDDQGNIYLAGAAIDGYPVTTNALQPTHGGGGNVVDGTLTIIGKLPPTAVIDISSPGYPSATSPLASPYQVLTFETITLSGTNSLDGDDPIDPGLSQWVLKAGGTVIDTDAGSLAPTFPGHDPLAFPDDGIYQACLTVDDGSGSTYDHNDTTCVALEWLNRPPVPTCSAPAQAAVGRAAMFTGDGTDLDGNITSWSWDFGDGNTSTLQNASHTYTQNGSYTVRLTATDDDGATATAICTVNVLFGPTAAFTAAPDPAPAGATVTFTDASLAGAAPIATWTWDFGDGTMATGKGPHGHIYADPGIYTVRLTVHDGSFQSVAVGTVTVVDARPTPAADAYVTPENRTLTVDAPGVLQNDGAGLTATLVTPPSQGTVTLAGDGSFVYTPPTGFIGVTSFQYEVDDGAWTVGPVDVQITVRPFEGPIAAFDAHVTGRRGAFVDTSLPGDNPITAWDWTFSDGDTSTGQHPVRMFSPGTYTITLTVTDAHGLWDTTSRPITILPPPLQEPGGSGSVGGPDGGAAGGGHDGTGDGTGDGLDTAQPQPNQPPVPVITAPAAVQKGMLVILDANDSYDPDGDPLYAAWRTISGPSLSLARTLQPQFIAGLSGTYVFELSLSDGAHTVRETVSVQVGVTPSASFDVEAVAPGSFRFVDTSGAAPELTRMWSFGDGSSAEGAAVHHTFEQGGSYVVTLRIEPAGVAASQRLSVAVPSADGPVDQPRGPPAEAVLQAPSEAAARAPPWAAMAALAAMLLVALALLTWQASRRRKP